MTSWLVAYAVIGAVTFVIAVASNVDKETVRLGFEARKLALLVVFGCLWPFTWLAVVGLMIGERTLARSSKKTGGAT